MGGGTSKEPNVPAPAVTLTPVVYLADTRTAEEKAAAVVAEKEKANQVQERADQLLAKRRRVTPEQAAAVAQAAQRIGELAATAEAAPEEERAAPTLGGVEAWTLYGGGTIESLLEHTPLVDLEYVVALAEGGGVMPCGRQHVPPAALITTRNVWRLKLWNKRQMKSSLGILVLSYPWLNWFHPDQRGAQLRRLLPFLKAMLASAKRDSPLCTVGLMVDFLCLPQKPFATEEDGARLGVSLEAFHSWYFHKFTYTLLLTNAPPEGSFYSNPRLHRDRGWCFFEQAASMVAKNSSCLLDFGAYAGATEFGDSRNDGLKTCIGQMKVARTPPIAPGAFGTQMRARVGLGELKFTSDADMELLIGQYEAGFLAAINRVASGNCVLLFEGLRWGDAEVAVLLLALRYAAAKCAFPMGPVKVYLKDGNLISKEAMATLPPSKYSDFAEKYAEWKGKFITE